MEGQQSKANNYNIRFIGLDRLIKKRKWYSFVDIEVNENVDLNDPNIYFDNEWLAITKAFNDCVPSEDKLYNYSGFTADVTFV